MITAIILTKNEEGKIEKCLKSLLWCSEIIIVDDYSTDHTLEIAKKYTQKIYKRKLNRDYSSQRNYALDQAKGDWVLFVDADEWVGTGLKNEIQNEIKNNKKVSGYYFKRSDYFLGRWLRYGETSDVRLLRLAGKKSGRWTGKVHEVWEIKGETRQFSNPLFHYSHESILKFLTSINRYSDIISHEKVKNGTKVNLSDVILYPGGKFIQNYILKKGYRDGMPGLVIAVMMSFHSFLVRSKIYILTHNPV